MPNTLLQLNIPLNGTGTEIPALNISDTYNVYYIFGTATAIGNYAIVPTGTPFAGLLFHFKYKATLDITTNGTTFSLFGTTITQTQLLKNWEAECYYDGTSWEVVLSMDFSEPGIISSANLGTVITGTNLTNSSIDGCTKLQNLSVCTAKIADDAITTVKILDANVTDAKITDVNGSKVINNTITNAKLATMSNNTVKANVSGATAIPSDVSIPILLNSNAWTTTGNSGLIAGTNFIGTTDATDLVFKYNNLESGRINVSLSNTSFGYTSLLSNSSGFSNAAFGYASLSSNSYGNRNVAFGAGALTNLVSGSDNVAIGLSSGNIINSGSSNTCIGASSSVNSATANSRIALGASADSTLDYQFALPDNVLNIKLRGTNYILPATDGTANQTLTTNGGGTLSWKNNLEPITVTLPISFESGEQTTTKTVWYPSSNQYRLSTAFISVVKTFSGTDDALLTINFDSQANILFDSPSFGTNVIIPASTATGSFLIFSNTGSYSQSTNTNALLKALNLTATKATPGGKIVVSLIFHIV